MKIEAVDITTSLALADPKLAYELAAEVNRLENYDKEMGVEVYPFTRSIPFAVAAVDTLKIQKWELAFGAKTVRVHLPWMYDWAEIRHQIRGDWYHGVSDWGMNQAVEYAMGPATNGNGLRIAGDRRIGVNVHPNVTAGYAKTGKLDELKRRAAYVLAENSIDFGSIHQPNREILGDPTVTVRHEIQEYGLSGFLLAMDHLFGLDKVADSNELFHRTVQVAKYLEDPAIQEHTRAIHLSLPGHQFIEVDDKNLEFLLKQMAQAPFKHPVRVALDFRSRAFDKMSYPRKVVYLCSIRDRILNSE